MIDNGLSVLDKQEKVAQQKRRKRANGLPLGNCTELLMHSSFSQKQRAIAPTPTLFQEQCMALSHRIHCLQRMIEVKQQRKRDTSKIRGLRFKPSGLPLTEIGELVSIFSGKQKARSSAK